MNTRINRNEKAFRVTGDWNIQSKHLKRKYPELTDIDLDFEFGEEDNLFSKLGKKLNKEKEEVIGIIKKGHPERSKTNIISRIL